MPKLYFLHGFLGDPSDWDEVISYLKPFACHALEYPFQLPKEGVLIGYSMGGRIAFASHLPKIIIASHLGLLTEDDRKNRAFKEAQWIHELENSQLEPFLKRWYDQPLFDTLKRHPSFPLIVRKRMKNNCQQLIHQMKEHALSRQSFHVPSNTEFIHGEWDTTYATLYRKWGIPSYPVPKAGHAVHLENPSGLSQVIQQLLYKKFKDVIT